MKHFILAIAFSCTGIAATAQDNEQFVTSDIDHFWEAYDQITTTRDTVQQYQYLQTLFLEKGSPGLKGIMEARRYTAKSYIDAINSYPQYWNSIRANTLKAKAYAKEIAAGVEQLKRIYPELKPAKIYFTIGAFRTNGTIKDGDVLIGSEMALGDEHTVTTELPQWLSHLKIYLAGNPAKEIAFLNVHEYVHTQQKTDGGYDLLSQSLYEGVAEFIPTIAMGKASPTPAIAYGKANEARVKAVFEKEMFAYWIYNWIWNSAENEFGIRDLGYFMGYAIAEKYYNAAKDKQKAIHTLINLDYFNQKEVESFVDKTGYFSRPLKQLKKEYEKTRPTVTGIGPFKNKQQDVNPALTEITIRFSEEMDTRFRSTDFGKLGKDHFPEIVSAAFAEDGKSVTYQVKLEPNKRYQMVIAEGFRTKKAAQLVAYTIDIKTAAK